MGFGVWGLGFGVVTLSSAGRLRPLAFESACWGVTRCHTRHVMLILHTSGGGAMDSTASFHSMTRVMNMRLRVRRGVKRKTRTRTHTHTDTHTYTYRYAHIHIQIHTHTHTCKHIHTRSYAYAHTHLQSSLNCWLTTSPARMSCVTRNKSHVTRHTSHHCSHTPAQQPFPTGPVSLSRALSVKP